MELWASGFNAFGQLDFEEGEKSILPEDLKTFKCLLKEAHVKLICASISATIVQISNNLKVAGHPDQLTQHLISSPDLLSQLVLAGNDSLLELNNGTINQYPSLSHAISISNAGTPLPIEEEVIQIIAAQTHFTVLTRDGNVYTWGDGRYESCLGREISSDCPATTPHLVPDLTELPTGPITKISSGGYITGALTSGHDLYIWGGRAGQDELFPWLSGEPTPVELDVDVQDFAVGNDHLIVLSTTGKLFVVGQGGSGQLGLGKCMKKEEWMEVVLPLKENQQVVSVHAGYKTSFIVIDDSI